MSQLHGTYRASDNLTYEYDATWNEHSAGLLWSATILREGRVLDHLEGRIPSVTGAGGEPESLVRNSVHEAIELRPSAK